MHRRRSIKHALTVLPAILMALVVGIAAPPAPVAAVASGTPGPVLFARYDGLLDQYFLWALVPGSEPVLIPNTDGARSGRWSPDGGIIAFTIYQDGIFLINVDGSGRRRIVDPEPGKGYSNPVWSPDGTRLAFSVYEGGSAQGHVEIIDALGAELVSLDTGLSYVSDWTDDYLLGSAWRDYEHVLNQNEEIARYWLETETFEWLTDSTTQDGVPRVSPDGSQIIWLRSDPPRSYDYRLWIMNADKSNPHELKFLGSQVTWPAWSPDGTKVVFGPTVTAIDVDDSTEQVLGGYGEDGFDWAPLLGTTEAFDIAGIRALGLPDPSAIASASASSATIKPTSSTALLLTSVAVPRTVAIRQFAGEPATMSLKIYKPSGALLKTVTYGFKTGSLSYTWNGKLANGKLAPTGKYKFVAKAVDMAGNVKKKTLYVKVIR